MANLAPVPTPGSLRATKGRRRIFRWPVECLRNRAEHHEDAAARSVSAGEWDWCGLQASCRAGVKGLIRTILTCTVFEQSGVTDRAERSRRPHIPHIAEVNRNSDDLREFAIFNRAQIVWLHGKAEQYSDRNLAGETEKLEHKLILDLLVPMLTDGSPPIVIGYRAAEPSITVSLLGKNIKRTQNFKNGLTGVCSDTGLPPLIHGSD